MWRDGGGWVMSTSLRASSTTQAAQRATTAAATQRRSPCGWMLRALSNGLVGVLGQQQQNRREQHPIVYTRRGLYRSGAGSPNSAAIIAQMSTANLQRPR